MALTALITGASAGLGAEFARLFAADKHDLILVARRKDRLESLGAELAAAHGVVAHVIAADLGTSTGVAAVIDGVQAKGLEVDFLVNNAGFGDTGPFVEARPERTQEMIQVNISALTALTRAFVPGMIARKRGRVLNLGSTAGFLPGPYMATYYASKAFVNSFSEALSFELRGTGVTATVSCPGPTATEFSGVSGNDKTALFQSGGAATAASVAQEAYDAMHAGKRLTVHGAKMKVQIFSLRFSPRGMAAGIAAKLNQPRS